MRKERSIDVGAGFVRARECPDCGHTRCGEDCNCNCDAARAEHEAAALRAEVERLRAAATQDRNKIADSRDEARAQLATLRAAAQAVVDDFHRCREANSFAGFWTILDDLAAELDGRADAARDRHTACRPGDACAECEGIVTPRPESLEENVARYGPLVPESDGYRSAPPKETAAPASPGNERHAEILAALVSDDAQLRRAARMLAKVEALEADRPARIDAARRELRAEAFSFARAAQAWAASPGDRGPGGDREALEKCMAVLRWHLSAYQRKDEPMMLLALDEGERALGRRERLVPPAPSAPATTPAACCAGKPGCPGGTCYVDPGILGCSACGGRLAPATTPDTERKDEP